MFLASLSLLSYLLFFFFFVTKTAAPTPATHVASIAMAREEETLIAIKYISTVKFILIRFQLW